MLLLLLLMVFSIYNVVSIVAQCWWGWWGAQPKMVCRRPLLPFPFYLAMLSRLLVFPCLLLLVFGLLRQNQKDSLLALYSSTGGPFWTNRANWNNATDPCTAPWFGVTCDAQKEQVIWLDLPSNNLRGSLPDLKLPALIVPTET